MNFDELSDHARSLSPDYTDEEAQESWEGSPFAWIRTLAPRTKGAIGLRLSETIISDAGVSASRAGGRLMVGEHRIVTRFSMEWTAGGFKFEQLKDNNYDFVFCLGVRPTAAFAWLIPKSEILVDGTLQERDNLGGQHRGAAATDTFWLGFNPEAIPEWLQNFGGTISKAEAVIRRQLR